MLTVSQRLRCNRHHSSLHRLPTSQTGVQPAVSSILSVLLLDSWKMLAALAMDIRKRIGSGISQSTHREIHHLVRHIALAIDIDVDPNNRGTGSVLKLINLCHSILGLYCKRTSTMLASRDLWIRCPYTKLQVPFPWDTSNSMSKTQCITPGAYVLTCSTCQHAAACSSGT